MVDLYYVYCLYDKDLQVITKTQVVGLQKWSIRLIFVWLLLSRYEGNESPSVDNCNVS